MKFRSLLMAIALAIFSTVTNAADKDMTNDDVIAMVKGGLDASTVVAKIRQSGRHTSFDTSVEALIKLKKTNLSKEVIEAMLTAGVAAIVAGGATSNSTADVQLVTSEGVVDLQSLQGESSVTYIGIGFLRWLNFDRPHSAVTIKDPNASIRLRSMQKPDSRVYVVRVESNNDDRSVKIGRARAFSATAGTTPDREWTIDYTSREEEPGIWTLTLTRSLAKGEYGLLRGSELFDFAVD